MKKVQRNWECIRAELNDKISACKLNAKDLSCCANIDYYAARRYLKNGAKNRNTSVLLLCSFFNIEIEIPEFLQSKELQKLLEAIEDVWDGTATHAEFIAELIRSTQAYKIEGKR